MQTMIIMMTAMKKRCWAVMPRNGPEDPRRGTESVPIVDFKLASSSRKGVEFA